MRKNDPEQQFPWTAIAGAIFTAIIATVLLNYHETHELVCGRWTSKPETADQSCIRNYIYDFQTLITGVLAVAAAYFTVRQMQETDRLAEQRHRDQIQLQMRPDKLKLERRLIPALRLYRGSSEQLKDIYERLIKKNSSLAAKLNDYRREVHICFETANMVLHDATEWENVIDLFDANVATKMTAVQDQVGTLYNSAKAIRDCNPSEIIRRGNAMADKEFEITVYPATICASYQALDELIDGLKKLGETYSIEIGS
ncbi:hypothetical protein [Rhizobium paknamense]|uniref:Uncharacterized protein n=1 Tax=Rhizobium paknamense TaxID=1206817 RepID=A0ABU0I8U5_9HYPH|nr:hypothetical protein [Rhizobium paknamense]MDQ0454632.1 hypothetical protein [Rhizobium paknamense]